MKLLTFMQIAETKSEISFGEIQQHLQLADNEVEEFLIDRKCTSTSVTRLGIGLGQICGLGLFLHKPKAEPAQAW
jgi:hypothetical protein